MAKSDALSDKVIVTVTVEPALTDVDVTVAVGAVASLMIESSAFPDDGASSMLLDESVARV